ncbi:hypothetical protein DB30_06294 [Enhygromyxa salina]|uniref:Universal stress protein family protein n=1 Tax=Enhygromyxa salina TaxID=215803 RepID=A0A0C2CUP2_9BACT|nr:hypothetical protein [Enhygromyxa salina]KIG14841.1 hypothetical protein DB30_06294 [Enhygromyxa salina]
MSTLDHFESAFRSASKDTFTWAPPHIRKILVITDLDAEASAQFQASLEQFLASALASVPGGAATPQWRLVKGDDYALISELHRLVEDWAPDLVCTYRNLHSSAWALEFSLGEFVDVLTQATPVPILIAPHPKRADAAPHALRDTDVVMAMTDHLTGSQRLINFAAAMTQAKGKLWLTHVEDELAYARIMQTISKIPQIETDLARKLIREKLLQQPTDYVEACRAVIIPQRPGLDVRPLIVMGHHLSTYRQLVRDHRVDLLVMDTKDEDQLAMHGMAYPIAVEIRDIPLLLL